jgi:hypothetical protein
VHLYEGYLSENLSQGVNEEMNRGFMSGNKNSLGLNNNNLPSVRRITSTSGSKSESESDRPVINLYIIIGIEKVFSYIKNKT